MSTQLHQVFISHELACLFYCFGEQIERSDQGFAGVQKLPYQPPGRCNKENFPPERLLFSARIQESSHRHLCNGVYTIFGMRKVDVLAHPLPCNVFLFSSSLLQRLAGHKHLRIFLIAHCPGVSSFLQFMRTRVDVIDYRWRFQELSMKKFFFFFTSEESGTARCQTQG